MDLQRSFSGLSIRKKFIVSTIVAVIFCSALFTSYSWYSMGRVEAEFEKRAELLAQTVGVQSLYSLLMEDKAGLKENLKQLIATGNANAGAFYSRQGELFVSEGLTQIRLPKVLRNNMEVGLYWSETVSGEPVLVSVQNIRNGETGDDEGYIMVSMPAGSLKSQQRTSILITIFGAVIFLMFGLGAIVRVNQMIIKPVEELNRAAHKVAAGDYDVHVLSTKSDEVGLLIDAFNGMVANSKEFLEKLRLESEAAQKAREKSEILQKQAQEEQRYLHAQFEKIEEVISAVTNGDLSLQLAIEQDDAVGNLMKKINRMIVDLRTLIGEVHHATESVSSAAESIAQSAGGLSAGATEQADQTNEVVSSIEEMSETILESSRSAAEAAEIAAKTSELASKGETAFQDTLRGMQSIAKIVKKSAETVNTLGQSSQQIGEIIQVIDDIADQTNLLALNAAIEAARAGEQGRGFAVVADEVRKLAERTTSATKEIGEMIKRIQGETKLVVRSMNEGTSQVENGMKLADNASVSLSEIISSVSHIVERINQIAAASHQQSSAAEEISHNMERISHVANQVSSATGELAGTSDTLSELTRHLRQLIEHFRLGGRSSAASIRNGDAHSIPMN